MLNPVVVFQGHDDRFSIYVHASRVKVEHVSPHFVDRDIRSEKVGHEEHLRLSASQCSYCSKAALLDI